jgi:hypothetical protein
MIRKNLKGGPKMKRSSKAITVAAALAFSVARHSVVASVIKLRDDYDCGSGLFSARL